MSEEAVKPSKVVPGQRWHSVGGGREVTVEKLDGWKVDFTVGSWQSAETMLTDPQWTYLGGPSPMSGEGREPGAPKAAGALTDVAVDECANFGVAAAGMCKPGFCQDPERCPPCRGTTVSPLTARSILQAKEQARAAKREEDARAVAAFCSEWDLLPDVTP